MSKSSVVELDFLGLDNKPPTKINSSIRGIQSRLNPALLRSVMGGAAANRILTAPSLPVFNPASTSVNVKQAGMTGPLTIFYNGTVAVFYVDPEGAEAIMKVAGAGTQSEGILDKLRGDLPIARKKSLQRFLEKRKERLTAMAPYGSSENIEAELGKEKEKEKELTKASNV